ncbi:MAG TPA: ABC transporter permease [Kofleriaceae bacterium]|jgi:ABC-type lipoprotein release transport system permease subunit|nr:ABC transporter permease [Kofleriaceae bacterium]
MSGVAMVLTASVVMLFVSALVGLISNINKTKESELTKIFVMPASVGGEQPCSLGTILKEIPGVKTMARWRRVTGRHPATGTTYLVVGEEPIGLELNTDIFPVTPQEIEAWKKDRTAAIVTDIIARDLNLRIGQHTELPTPQGGLQVNIVGVSYGSLIPKRVAVHFDYLDEFVGRPPTCRFRLYCNRNDYESVAREIITRTKNSGSPVQGVSTANMSTYLARVAGILPAVLGFLGLFLIFVTALTLANTTAITVRERRTETATLRVLGYHRGTIVRLLLSEAVLLGLIGGIIAIVINVIVFRNGVQLAPGHDVEPLPPVRIGLPGIIAALVVSLVVPLAGALPAALKSVRTPLGEALRDTA